MSVLLTNATVRLWTTIRSVDGHGWDAGTETDGGEWFVSFQEQMGVSDATMTDAGGAGPASPAVTRTGLVYFPPDAPVTEGDVVELSGTRWRAGTVQESVGPSGVLACKIVEVTA